MSIPRLRPVRVRELRERRNMTQPELASLLGVNPRQILRYEKGETDPNSETLGALAVILNTTSDYLIGLTNDPKPRLVAADLVEDERELIVALRNKQYAKAIRALGSLTEDGE